MPGLVGADKKQGDAAIRALVYAPKPEYPYEARALHVEGSGTFAIGHCSVFLSPLGERANEIRIRRVIEKRDELDRMTIGIAKIELS